MSIPTKLADDDHPIIRETARRLTQNQESPRDRLRSLFKFVRDDILFGYPAKGDIVKASQVLRLGYGQCNNKAALLLALARAAGLEARVHFSSIDKVIQKGIFPQWVFDRFPDELSHAWVEVKIEGRWRRIDSFINDMAFYQAGRKALRERGWKTGFSISCESGESSAELDIDDERFVQMDAVTGDHGTYDDPVDYYRSPKYLNRPSALTLLLYSLVRGRANRKVKQMRLECPGGICQGLEQAEGAA